LYRGGIIKKLLYGFLILVVVGYFGVGYYVYDISATVPCAVWEGEQTNNPSNFSGWDEYDVNVSQYFVSSYETVSIDSTDNVVLSGWWMENNPQGKTVLIIHGLTSSKYSSGILLASGILYQNGFNVLAIDMRDHGDSTCEDGYYSAGQKESDDSASAVEWLVNEKNINPDQIGIYGQSLGALTALQTGAKTQNFAAVAVHDPPVAFETLVREEMVYQGFPPVLYTPVLHYARIFKGENLTEVTPQTALESGNKQPVLVFNGLLDERVQAHHTEDLIKIADDNGIDITVYRYEDMGHVESLWGYNDEFSEAIVSFFDKHLSS
jgi:hypothetical protein